MGQFLQVTSQSQGTSTKCTKAAAIIFFLLINHSVRLQLSPTIQSDWRVWAGADEYHEIFLHCFLQKDTTLKRTKSQHKLH